MRFIGHAERALELMLDRVHKRIAFGKTLAEQGTIQQDIALSRIEIGTVSNKMSIVAVFYYTIFYSKSVILKQYYFKNY